MDGLLVGATRNVDSSRDQWPCRTFSEYTYYLEDTFRRDAEEECSGLVAPEEMLDALSA